MGLCIRAGFTIFITSFSLSAGLSTANAAEWTSQKLNSYTSDSIAQLLWLPGDGANPTRTGYECIIETMRPTAAEGSIESGEGGIRCTNWDSEPFALPLHGDRITAFGTRNERVQFEFRGMLQNFISEALRAAIRASATPSGGSTDARVNSGELCSPDESFCLESMYLNDSDDVANSGASLICVRSSDRTKLGQPRNPNQNTGAWIDEEIRIGALKVSNEYCVFTGP